MTGDAGHNPIPDRHRQIGLVLAGLWAFLEWSGWSGKMGVDAHRKLYFMRVTNGIETHVVEAIYFEDFIRQVYETFPAFEKSVIAEGDNLKVPPPAST